MPTVDERRLTVEASHVTAVSTVRGALRDPRAGVGHSLVGMRAAGLVASDATVQDAYSAASRWMLARYRNEWVYKNAIANQILLQRHGINSAAHINEMKVGTSVADCVVINGQATVYEIKTELDNSTKLFKQLSDYRAAFKRVVVVTHHSLADHYAAILVNEPVGLMSLTQSGRLRTIRAASDHTADLSVDAMMKTLRRAEYVRIAEQISGAPVDAPPTKLFRECLSIGRSTAPVDYGRLHEQELRKRKARAGVALADERFMHVRHQLLTVDPTVEQLVRLGEWMSGRA